MEILRRLRHDKKLTLGSVSQGTGLTKSYISQIERGLKEPSIEALRKISTFLGVSPSLLLSENNTAISGHECVVMKKGDRARTVLFDKDAGSSIETLSPEQGRSGLRAYLVTVEPGKSVSGKQITHIHAEFAYVISGECDAHIGSCFYHMSSESSIFVAPMVPHDYLNHGNTCAHILFSFSD